MENINVKINDIEYNIELNEYINITKFSKEGRVVLDKKYDKIKKRLYNNIINVTKLKDGLIRKYQFYTELEMEVFIKYLTDKNMPYIIYYPIMHPKGEVYKYKLTDKSYKIYFYRNEGVPEKNYLSKSQDMYIEVYKGFVNLSLFRYSNIRLLNPKYGIYL
jgi:hypothetical protein